MNLINKENSGFKIIDLCWALDIPRPTFYRFRTKVSSCDNSTRPSSKRKLSDKEKKIALDLLVSSENIDKSPTQVYYEQLDNSIYICSISSLYRILRENDALTERRKIKKHLNFSRPELIAEAPNEVWSWDVSKLKGPVKLSYFYLYTIIDIYSRLVVGWTVAERETSEIAKKMFLTSFGRQNIDPGLLVVHSDRGAIMKSERLSNLYEKIGVARSLNRPYVSNDNPFSEANFKTLKYRPDYPDRFDTIYEADQYLNKFYNWYNSEHYHSAIEMLTPEDVHYGNQVQTISKRTTILEKVKSKYPERFLGNKKKTSIFEGPVYINKPLENVS